MEQTIRRSGQRRLVMALMMMTAGMMGAYTYLIRGGVFCNAQTGNLLLMGITFGSKGWKSALYYFIPFASYMAGTVVSEILRPKSVSSLRIQWATIFSLMEIAVFVLVGFVPKSVPDSIIQCLIMFVAASQYNSFQKAGNITMATTFCTNHVRQLGIHLYRWIQKRDAVSLSRVITHTVMIACFVIGAMSVSGFHQHLAEKTIWLAIGPTSLAALIMLREDLEDWKIRHSSQINRRAQKN